MNKSAPSKAGAAGRRSERVLLKIPIKVEGKNAEGKPFTETTYTLVINRHGGRINLNNSPRNDDGITITNLYNQLACPFRVVGRAGKSLGEGPEWGVECLEPERNIWGIHFPEKKEPAAGGDAIDALLECKKCSFRELAPLGREHYQMLVAQASLQRDCPKCKARTEWTFSFVDEASEELVSADAAEPAPAPAPAAAPEVPPAKPQERRREKRLTLKVPVRVRLGDGREDITRTENYSRSGACIVSKLGVTEGEKIQATVGYTGGSSDLESPARVVWLRPMEGTELTIFGLELLKNR